MKKGLLAKVFKMGLVFASIYTGIFGYIINLNTVYAISDEDKSYVIIDRLQYEEVEETKEEEVVLEEKVVETRVEEPTTYNVYVPPVTSNVITGNSIKVASIYNHLMSDNGDSFYLNHDLNGNYDGRGVPFVDFRNDFTGRKSIVYAHSSTSGNGPFQALQNYHNNPGFYQNNRTITVNYNGQTYTYLIFSVYVSTATDEYSDGLEYYYRMNYSDEEWGQVIQNYKNHSEYETGVSVNSNDKIIILQTCSMDPNYYEKYYRYNLLIMGKLI